VKVSMRHLAHRRLPHPVRSAPVQRLGLEHDPRCRFARAYGDAQWGEGGGGWYSGDGRQEAKMVEPCVAAVRAHLATRPQSPVDLGCGDFHVGARLLDAADRTVACDVVPEPVARNRARFDDPRVTFEVIDAVGDPLPEGDVVCVRQVPQHLSNALIATIAAKLARSRHWIPTEHVPTGEFVPNADKPPGREIRFDWFKSGVVLSAPPSDVRPARTRVLSEVPQWIGVVRTVAYNFED
jgi:hypothetical protein